MVDGSDARAGTTEEPERLFSSDPELVRIRALLDRDGPPAGAAGRVLAKTGAAVRSLDVGRASSSALRLSLIAGAAVLVVAASESTHTAHPRTGILSTTSPVGAAADVFSGPPSSAPGAPIVESVPTETFRVEDLPRAAARVAVPSASAADPFEQELALVELARAALAGGRGRECLDVAAQYRNRFASKGQFNEEIEVMRIEALAMTGERAPARAQAARFLEQHGETPYADRLGRVLEQSAGEP